MTLLLIILWTKLIQESLVIVNVFAISIHSGTIVTTDIISHIQGPKLLFARFLLVVRACWFLCESLFVISLGVSRWMQRTVSNSPMFTGSNSVFSAMPGFELLDKVVIL